MSIKIYFSRLLQIVQLENWHFSTNTPERISKLLVFQKKGKRERGFDMNIFEICEDVRRKEMCRVLSAFGRRKAIKNFPDNV